MIQCPFSTPNSKAFLTALKPEARLPLARFEEKKYFLLL
jgi:hypothetical protein